MVEPWLFLEPCWNGKKNENKAGLPKAMPQRQCSGLGLKSLPQATVLNLVQRRISDQMNPLLVFQSEVYEFRI